ncbi:S1C family serine protease [Nocardioides nanhaiensis]|uniref:Trypsin-like peptidase domain-containing protein n=1 Tax=Nocardioides nanhaiensis TaxID=1476871 RepID=A0ABP8VWL7_9ACTN
MSQYPTFPPPSEPPTRREDTQPLPADGSPRHHDGDRDTRRDNPFETAYAATGAGQAPPPYGAAPQRPVPPARGRRRFAATVVAASLLVGGGAGIGGAAAYSALAGEDGGAGATTVRTSQVVDTPDTPAADGSVESVAQSVLPSTVELDVTGAGESGSGSGAILSSDGLILTNEHVAGLAGEGGSITVRFADGSKAPGEIVGLDPLTDTALVQAQDVSGLTPITIGTSGDLQVGEPVVAIGSPFGLESTVTTGIVSALDRPVEVGTDAAGNSTTYPAIQTDAAINPGNSGGPLVDMNGHLVGINSSIRSTGSSMGGEAGSIGLGFAIPVDDVLPIIDQMQNGETPTHAQLGITVGDVAQTGVSSATVTEGAEIQEINDGSAAGDAGLEPGDVITAIDDAAVDSSSSLVATIRSYRPGDKVEVTYERDGEEATTTLTLGSDAEQG